MAAGLDLFAGEGDASPVFEVTVYGSPQTAGSKRAYVFKPKGGGRPQAAVTDDNPKSDGWKNQVAQIAGESWDGPLLDGPLVLTLTFFRSRPVGHLGAPDVRGVRSPRPSAPAYPITRPDALKLARGVEDALSKVIYRDDSQIVDEHLYKRYGEPERVEISLSRLPAKVKDR